MWRVLYRVVIALSVMMSDASVASADNRPVEQLPADIVRWSTLWTLVPEQMAESHLAQGPVAGVTIGVARGVAKLVCVTGEEVWHIARTDRRPGHRHEPGALLLRYEF